MLTHRIQTLRIAMVLVLLVFHTGTLALAGPVADDFEPMVAPTADCIVGNTNAPGLPPVDDVFHGREKYAYLIFPEEECNCTEDGFKLEAVHQMLDFTMDQTPSEFVVSAGLMTAIVDGTTGCLIPGDLLFLSPPVNMVVLDDGLFEVNVPTPNSEIYPQNDHYFLVLFYDGLTEGQLVIDNDPRACTEFVERGNGWEDLNLIAKSGGGKMIVWGDVICAPLTVDTERSSLDSIKCLYR